jgi:hypothetical protein
LEQVYLNPSFLVLLSILLIATFVNPMGQVSQYAAQGNYIDKPLFTGMLDGYNTMDALASLAFAIVIISNLENLNIKSTKRKVIEICKSGLVCLIGMSIIYASLAYMEIVKNLKKMGKTVVMVIHDLNSALTFSDMVCLMDKGEVVIYDKPQAIYESGKIEEIFNVKCHEVGASDKYEKQYIFSYMSAWMP